MVSSTDTYLNDQDAETGSELGRGALKAVQRSREEVVADADAQFLEHLGDAAEPQAHAEIERGLEIRQLIREPCVQILLLNNIAGGLVAALALCGCLVVGGGREN